MTDRKVRVAIVDFGLGNLFSVKQACEFVGMDAVITSSQSDLFASDVVFLPGVGAYGDAMQSLRKLDLVEPLREIGGSDKWLIGICLGFQLLMTESYEFGTHQGLGIIDGVVVPLESPIDHEAFDGSSRKLKVPQVGWSRVWSEVGPRAPSSESPASWVATPLNEVALGEYMYFVHSFYVQPSNQELILSTSRYGHIEFCSSIKYNNVFACQFHPERSGWQGLHIYRNIANMVKTTLE